MKMNIYLILFQKELNHIDKDYIQLLKKLYKNRFQKENEEAFLYLDPPYMDSYNGCFHIAILKKMIMI
jgi:site-specific DNA-adenine methylase